MGDAIERPFELRCPTCKEWTNINCTDEELFPKSLNRVCPHCSKPLNYYLPTSDVDGTLTLELAYSVEYRTRIMYKKTE